MSMTMSGVVVSASRMNAGSNAEMPAAVPASAPRINPIPAVTASRRQLGATPRYQVASPRSATVSVNRARHGAAARQIGMATAAPAQAVVAMPTSDRQSGPPPFGPEPLLANSGSRSDGAGSYPRS